MTRDDCDTLRVRYRLASSLSEPCDVTRLVAGLDAWVRRNGLSLSRWESGSRARPYTRTVTWTVHRGARASHSRSQRDVLATVTLRRPEGMTARSNAFAELHRLWLAAEAAEGAGR